MSVFIEMINYAQGNYFLFANVYAGTSTTMKGCYALLESHQTLCSTSAFFVRGPSTSESVADRSNDANTML